MIFFFHYEILIIKNSAHSNTYTISNTNSNTTTLNNVYTNTSTNNTNTTNNYSKTSIN